MAIILSDIDRAICEKFHVHGVQFTRDSPPYMGYAGTRNDLAQLFADLNYTEGAEIGVNRGRYSDVMLKRNPKLHINCVDPWKAFDRNSDARMERAFRRAHQKLDVYGDRVTWVRKTSVEAAKDFKDGSLDFVYIDAMHYFDFVMVDIILWTPKVRKGGIVSGHDYEPYPKCGVPIAVEAYTRAHGILPYYVTAKDSARSWMFAKQ